MVQHFFMVGLMLDMHGSRICLIRHLMGIRKKRRFRRSG